jgi:adenine-specific DNA-methyltransferase
LGSNSINGIHSISLATSDFQASPAIATSAKALGAFYTPEPIARLLADWVVLSGTETLLEPSAGDGALIKAAQSRAQQRNGSADYLRFVVCDIDSEAIQALERWLPKHSEMHSIDFLSLLPDGVPRVDGIIANPPFTRHHSLDPRLRSALRGRFSVSGAAGLWVYFLLHACDFLAPGGRLAAVIPNSALFTTYGKSALERICARFLNVELRRIMDTPLWGNRLQERGAIILAKGYKSGRSSVPSVSNWWPISDLTTTICEEGPACFREALAGGQQLDSIAELSIGAVTGCNRIFLLSEQERVEERIPRSDVLPIASRGRHVPGVIVTTEQLAELATKGEKTWLLHPSHVGGKATGTRKRLAKIAPSLRRTTIWLRKREPWWSVDARPKCDALFTYMNHRAPRLVLAKAGIRCTNTLHRVSFRNGVIDDQKRAASITMVSTFGQLAAEYIGRPYGGGVLKFELGNARTLPLLALDQEIDAARLDTIDLTIREGKPDDARALADEVVLPSIFGHGWESAVREMARELTRVRMERHAGRRR